MISFRPTAKFDKEATVIMLDEDQVKRRSYLFHNKPLEIEINKLINAAQFSGENGQIFPFVFKKTLVVLVGVGKKEKLSLTALRITVRKVLLSTYLNKVKAIEIIVNELKDTIIKATIESVLLGTYVFDKYKSEEQKKKPKITKHYFLVAVKKKAFEDAVLICEGTNFARDLINENADIVTSVYLERTIRQLVKGKKNISIEVLNRKEIEQKGLRLHLAVNKGSPNDPKLIIIKYNGTLRNGNYTAIIGKGITFDTGGLNLKPTGSMETMKMDMSGTAAVIGTLKNAISLNLKKNVIFACAIAENAIDARSYKPGDVIISYSGKTVEVGNTDAEGRLVLADAISYIVKHYKPARLIDIATLTGACIVALGHDYTGLVTTDDKFSRQLVHASNDTDDRAWRLPVYTELSDHVKSKIADIRNTGLPKGAAGAISAAEFLRQFTNDTTWAHLDIAGTAFVDGEGRWYYGHGATGAGVRLLTHYLQNN